MDLDASEDLRLKAARLSPHDLFTTKSGNSKDTATGPGPEGAPPGRAQRARPQAQGGPKGPARWPRAVSALPIATTASIDSEHCNRRPQRISGVDGEPRNADRLGPEASQDRSGAFGMGLTHSKGPSLALSWRSKSCPEFRFGSKSFKMARTGSRIDGLG